MGQGTRRGTERPVAFVSTFIILIVIAVVVVIIVISIRYRPIAIVVGIFFPILSFVDWILTIKLWLH